MKLPCPHCGQYVESGHAPPGARLPCAACGQTLIVPRPAPQSPAARASGARGARPSRAASSFAKPLAVLLLLAAGVLAAMSYGFRQSPRQIWERAADYVASVTSPRMPAAPGALATPAPPPSPEPDAVPATSAPVASGTPPSPAAAAKADSQDVLAWLGAHQTRWPKKITLARAMTFPVVYEGRQAGAGNVPAGSAVELISVQPPDAVVAYSPYGGVDQRVPIAATDLLAIAKARMLEPETALTPEQANRSPVPAAQDTPRAAGGNALDTLVFGSAASEKAHDLTASDSAVCQNELTVYGPGDIWDSQDVLIFRQQRLAGDGWIQARVISTGAANDWTKIGVMMRDSLDAKARNAFMFNSSGHGLHTQWRKDTGGGTGQGDSPALPEAGAYWVRVERKGSTFTMSASTDGALWTEAGTQQISMGSNIYMGLANSSASLDTINYATFDHVTSSAGDAPWTDSNIGGSAVHGGSMVTGLGEPSRRLLPQDPVYYYGGELTFRMKVDPDAQNYCTVKLWGAEGGDDMGRIALTCEGKEVGKRHGPGLDIFIHTDGPFTPGDFWYRTTILPRWLTKGKTSVEIKLRSMGSLFAYGKPWDYDTYQHKLMRPTRGLYRLYTHTNPVLAPGNEVQGTALDYVHAPVRPAPDEAADLAKRKEDLNHHLSDLLSKKNPNQKDAAALAEAYAVPWTVCSNKAATLVQITKALDATCREYHADPKLADAEWGGNFGPCGYALALTSQALGDMLEEKVDLGIGPQPRSDQYAAMLKASRDGGRFHRQSITNQAIINATNIYRANRGMLALKAKDAFSDGQAKRYLREAFGMEEWRGDDLPNGGSKWNTGHGVLMMTTKGTSHEWNWCCANCYGRMDPYAYEMYRFSGDVAFRDRAIQIEHAHDYMVYPSVDEAGYRAMLNEGVICTRNVYHPGQTFYGYANVASSLADASILGGVRQGMADHQFLDSWQISEANVFFPEDYEKLKTAPAAGRPLPSTPGQPDFVWADEQNAVLSIKHGAEQHFVTFARRASSIHHIGDAHSITPQGERVVQFWVDDVRFTPSGEVEKIGPEVESEFCGVPPDKPVNAWAGQEQPKAKPEFGLPGGIADFYSARYGDYLIAMNCTFKKSFEYQPEGLMAGMDLVSGKRVILPAQIPPQSTMVLYAPVKPGAQ